MAGGLTQCLGFSPCAKGNLFLFTPVGRSDLYIRSNYMAKPTQSIFQGKILIKWHKMPLD